MWGGGDDVLFTPHVAGCVSLSVCVWGGGTSDRFQEHRSCAALAQLVCLLACSFAVVSPLRRVFSPLWVQVPMFRWCSTAPVLFCYSFICLPAYLVFCTCTFCTCADIFCRCGRKCQRSVGPPYRPSVVLLQLHRSCGPPATAAAAGTVGWVQPAGLAACLECQYWRWVWQLQFKLCTVQ